MLIVKSVLSVLFQYTNLQYYWQWLTYSSIEFIKLTWTKSFLLELNKYYFESKWNPSSPWESRNRKLLTRTGMVKSFSFVTRAITDTSTLSTWRMRLVSSGMKRTSAAIGRPTRTTLDLLIGNRSVEFSFVHLT